MLLAEEGADLLGYENRDGSRWKDSDQEAPLHQLLNLASLPKQATCASPLIPRNTPALDSLQSLR